MGSSSYRIEVKVNCFEQTAEQEDLILGRVWWEEVGKVKNRDLLLPFCYYLKGEAHDLSIGPSK